MRLLKTLFSALFIITLIQGCSAFKPKPVVITKTEMRVISIPEELTRRVVPSTPPDPETFRKMEYEEKVKFLSNIIMELLGDVEIGNSRLEAIEKWVGEAKKILKE